MDRGYILATQVSGVGGGGGTVNWDWAPPPLAAGRLLAEGSSVCPWKIWRRKHLHVQACEQVPSQKAFFSSWSRMAWIRWTASFRACRIVSCPPVSTESSTSSSLVSSSSRHR